MLAALRERLGDVFVVAPKRQEDLQCFLAAELGMRSEQAP